MSALREVLVAFGVEFDDKGLKDGEKKVGGFIDKLKEAGKLIAGALVVVKIKEWVSEVIEEAAALDDLSKTIGVNAQELQKWQFAAKLSGVSAETLNASFVKLAKNAGEAAEGGKTQAAAFKKLGVEVKDQSGQIRPLSDLFGDAAAAIGELKNPTEKVQLAMDLFGKSGAKLLPLFNEGAAGMAKLRAEVEELGFTLDEDLIKSAAEADDNLDRLDGAFKGLKIRLASEVVPILSRVVIGFAKLVATFGKVLKQTSVVKAGLVALGVVGLVKLSALIGPLGTINSLLKVGARLLLKYVLPFLILEDFITFLEGGDSVIGSVLDKLFGPGASDKVRKFVNDVVKSVGDFFEDLKSRPGKIVEDFKLFWDTLEADATELFGPVLGGIVGGFAELWTLTINALTGGWDNFLAATEVAWAGIKLALEVAWTEIKFGFLGVAAAISDAFGNVWNSIVNGAAGTLKLVRDTLGKVPGMGDLVQKLNSAIESVGGSKVVVDAVAAIDASRSEARLGLAAKGDQIAAQAGALGGVINNPPGGSSSSVTNNTGGTTNTTVNVTVPPGTPAQQARAVGKAAAAGAAKGVSKGKATKAGLVQQAG